MAGVNLQFYDAMPQLEADAHRAEVPFKISGKEELMAKLSSLLRMPGYFGHNWDALNDMLCDLTWLPPGPVVLVHHDIPCHDRRDTAIYLSILEESIGKWRASRKDRLSAFFSASDRDEVLRTLASYGQPA